MLTKLSITISIILCFFLGDRIFTNIGLYLTKFSSLPEAKLYSGRLDSKILIVGNSRAYRHIHEKDWSEILDESVSNISMPGAPMVHFEVLLDDYVEIYGWPKKIIIELDCIFSDTEIISSYKFLTNYSSNYSLLLKEFDKKTFYFSQIINLYKLNSNIYLNALHKIFQKYEQPRLYGEISSAELSNFKSSKDKNNRFLIKEYNLESLKNIIRKYGKNSDLVLIISPYHPNIINYYSEEMVASISRLKTILKDDIKFFDFSREVFDDNFFNDLYHFNSKGVEELNSRLLDDNFFEKL